MDVRTAISDGQSVKGFATKKGWWPFLCGGIAEGEDGQGCVLYNTEGKALYVNTRVNRLSLDTPIWIRRHSERRAGYQISTLRTIDEETIEARFDAFKSFAALRDERLRQRARESISGHAVKFPAKTVATEALSAARVMHPLMLHKPTLHLQKDRKPVATGNSKTDLDVASGNGKKAPAALPPNTSPTAPSEPVSALSGREVVGAMEMAFARLTSTKGGSELLAALRRST